MNLGVGSATKHEISQFLQEFRDCPNVILLSNRRDGKNKRLLDKLAISTKDAIEITKFLRVCDYHKGPKPDFDRERRKRGETIWEFKKSIEGILVYIKIQVRLQPKGQAIIISFHEDEYEDDGGEIKS
ncbi:hypothetical protein [Lactovum odontotermitis]